MKPSKTDFLARIFPVGASILALLVGFLAVYVYVYRGVAGRDRPDAINLLAWLAYFAIVPTLLLTVFGAPLWWFQRKRGGEDNSS